MVGREKTAIQGSVSPLQGKAQAKDPPVGKFGRGSLASSHAGTRLPIAALAGPDPGRSPSARSRINRGAGNSAVSPRSLRKKVEKTAGDPKGPPAASDRMMTSYGGITHIRWRVEANASSQPKRLPCVFTRHIMAFLPGLVKAPAVWRRTKKSADRPCIGEKRGV